MARGVGSAPVVLLGHGSADPRSSRGLRGLAAALADRSGAPFVAFLDHDGPDLPTLAQEIADAGIDEAIVVPVFLSRAYHVRVDVQAAAIAATSLTGLRITLTRPLGLDDELLAAIGARLPIGVPVVVATAGTSDDTVRDELEAAVARWAARCRVPAVVGYAAMAQPDVATAIARVRDQHGVPPVILSATLFGGVMADRIASAADGLEVVGPIGTFAEVQRAIRARVAEVRAGVSDAARPRRRARVRQVVATLTRR